ncbi:hypothetical protein WN943_023997 [Citrus x changshan-huyou]
MKENTQELQSILRRRRGDESRLANKVGEYLSSRKKSNKVIHKSLRDLKSRCKVTSSENETPAIIEILREVEGVALAVFESLLSYISVAGPCIIHQKTRKSSSRTSAENALNLLGNLELSIQALEQGLESLQRRLIKTRVSLLNIISL